MKLLLFSNILFKVLVLIFHRSDMVRCHTYFEELSVRNWSTLGMCFSLQHFNFCNVSFYNTFCTIQTFFTYKLKIHKQNKKRKNPKNQGECVTLEKLKILFCKKML